jgi:hypothetical protein
LYAHAFFGAAADGTLQSQQAIVLLLQLCALKTAALPHAIMHLWVHPAGMVNEPLQLLDVPRLRMVCGIVQFVTNRKNLLKTA